MTWISSLLSFFLLFGSPASVVLAQGATSATATTTVATSTIATGSSSSSGSNGLAVGIGVGVGVGLAAYALFSPASSLLLKSFGGRVVASVPCVSSLGPSLFVTIVPAGIFAPTYIWTPLTITNTYGPPRNPGQHILGLADIPFVCWIPTTPPIFLYGLRMSTIGTSLF